jgi:effector-binding domain-containing protein
MKTFRRILLLILILALTFAAIGLLLPRKVFVERKLVMHTTPRSVFEQINSLRNWEKWSPWLLTDTAIQLIFTGPEAGTGASYSWSSFDKNIGRGSVTIVESVPYDSLLVLMDYGSKGESTGKFTLVKDNQNTIVIWKVASNLGINPISRWFGLFLDRMVGPDLESGLSNLDLLSTGNRMVNNFEILDYEIPAQVLLSIRDTASSGTVSIKLTTMYNKLSDFLKSKSLSPTGTPMTVFHSFSHTDFDIEACVPVKSLLPVPEGFTCAQQLNQKAVMIQYIGGYKYIDRAYTALQTYIKDNNLILAGPPREVYITNPAIEADSSKWQTDIMYPVK